MSIQFRFALSTHDLDENRIEAFESVVHSPSVSVLTGSVPDLASAIEIARKHPAFGSIVDLEREQSMFVVSCGGAVLLVSTLDRQHLCPGSEDCTDRRFWSLFADAMQEVGRA